jgi:hypothetical protein
MPALVALRYNPPVKAMRERMLAAGKAKMAIVGAASGCRSSDFT